jgi:type II secretory pathway pseudopilin PulG
MRARFYGDRHRAQAGTTLVELLVSLTIASLALALVVGTLSTGLLDATLAKRNTAAQAILHYEMEQISASAFNPSATSYSNCFAIEKPLTPTPATGGYLGSCASGYSLRSDVSWQPYSSGVQNWQVAISSWPAGTATGATVQLYKAPYQ